MPFVVVDPELVSDQASDPRTTPQRRREAVRLGTFQQQRYQSLPLCGVQQRLAPGTTGSARRSRTLLQVLPPLRTDRLPRYLQPPSRFRLIQALLE
ncbi:MAG: hypothetical protein OXB98_20615 [Bryobacterales bacterium]|nr:hypothetical protein [Bryobacterales bacterium]